MIFICLCSLFAKLYWLLRQYGRGLMDGDIMIIGKNEAQEWHGDYMRITTPLR